MTNSDDLTGFEGYDFCLKCSGEEPCEEDSECFACGGQGFRPSVHACALMVLEYMWRPSQAYPDEVRDEFQGLVINELSRIHNLSAEIPF